MQVMFLLAMMTAFYAVYTSFTHSALTTGALVRQQEIEATEEYFQDFAQSIRTLAVQNRMSLPVYGSAPYAYLENAACPTLPAGVVTATGYLTNMPEVATATPQRWQGPRTQDPWGNEILLYALPKPYHPGKAQVDNAATVAVTTQATGFVLASPGPNGCFGDETIRLISLEIAKGASANITDITKLTKIVPSKNPSAGNYDRYAVDDVVYAFHTKNAIDERFAVLEDQVAVILSSAMQRYQRMMQATAFQNQLNAYFASQMSSAFDASGTLTLSGSVNPDSWRFETAADWLTKSGATTDIRPNMATLLPGGAHDLKQLFKGEGTTATTSTGFNPWDFVENNNALEVSLAAVKSDAAMAVNDRLTLTLTRQLNPSGIEQTLNEAGEVAVKADGRVAPFDTNFQYQKTIGEDL